MAFIEKKGTLLFHDCQNKENLIKITSKSCNNNNNSTLAQSFDKAGSNFSSDYLSIFKNDDLIVFNNDNNLIEQFIYDKHIALEPLNINIDEYIPYKAISAPKLTFNKNSSSYLSTISKFILE